MRVDFFMPGMHPGSLVWDLYQDLCDAIRHRGVQVRFLTRAEVLGDHKFPDVVPLRSSRWHRWVGRAAAWTFHLRTSYLVPSAFGLARHLRRHGWEIDLLHVENVFPDGAAAMMAATAAGWHGPILVKPMGEDVLVVEDAAYGFRRFAIPRRLVSWVLRKAAGVRCTSPLIRDVVNEIGTTGLVRLIAVHTSVRTAELATDSPESIAAFRRRARVRLEERCRLGEVPVMLSLGRLHPYKGIDTLIEAVEQVPDAVLVIAGPSLKVEPWGDYRDHLERVATERGVRSRVHFVGRQSPPEALELLAAADVVMVPSYREAHNKVCIEAAAVRTPFVVTETTGISASVPAEGVGLMVPAGDPSALADAAGQILGGRWCFDADAAAAFARQFRPDRVAGQIVEMYEDLIRRCA